jgi:hypothetical protein
LLRRSLLKTKREKVSSKELERIHSSRVFLKEPIPRPKVIWLLSKSMNPVNLVRTLQQVMILKESKDRKLGEP